MSVRASFKIEGDRLRYFHIPCVVCEKGLQQDQVDHVVELMTKNLGAKYFLNDAALFLAVLEDYRSNRSKPMTWLSGPYISLRITQKNELRVGLIEELSDGGLTVYSYDQFVDIVSSLTDTPLDVCRGIEERNFLLEF